MTKQTKDEVSELVVGVLSLAALIVTVIVFFEALR